MYFIYFCVFLVVGRCITLTAILSRPLHISSLSLTPLLRFPVSFSSPATLSKEHRGLVTSRGLVASHPDHNYDLYYCHIASTLLLTAPTTIATRQYAYTHNHYHNRHPLPPLYRSSSITFERIYGMSKRAVRLISSVNLVASQVCGV